MPLDLNHRKSDVEHSTVGFDPGFDLLHGDHEYHYHTASITISCFGNVTIQSDTTSMMTIPKSNQGYPSHFDSKILVGPVSENRWW